jgi:hypothetical protein
MLIWIGWGNRSKIGNEQTSKGTGQLRIPARQGRLKKRKER